MEGEYIGERAYSGEVRSFKGRTSEMVLAGLIVQVTPSQSLGFEGVPLSVDYCNTTPSSKQPIERTRACSHRLHEFK